MVQTFYFFLFFFPLAYISGPFLLDLNLSLLSFLSLFFFYKNFNRINRIFLYLIIFWLIYLIFNSLLSIEPYLSLQSSLFYFRFFLFATFVYFVLEDFNFENYIYIFYFQFLIIILLFIDSLFQFYLGYNLIGYEYNNERISSFFKDEFILGSFISKLLPFIIFIYIINNRTHKNKIINLLNLYIFISFIIIMLSGDRLAFLNFLIILSCYIIYIFGSTLKLFICFLFFNLIFLLSLLISDSLYKRFFLTTLDQISFNIFYIPLPRSIEHLYTTAINIFLDYPIFGIGPKLFRIYCEYDIYKFQDGCSTHPHNTIIQLFVEIGIFGIIPFLIFLVYIYWKFLKNFFLTIFNIEKFNVINFLNIGFILNVLPIIPSGNFFNNRYSFFIFFYLGFYLFYKNKKL